MFIHLHTHSEYSIQDSLLTVEDLAKFAKANQMHSIALTDRNNLFGAIKFYNAVRELGVKPILGCDLSVRDEKGNVAQLVLLCKNQAGFKALCVLVSALQLNDHHPIKALPIQAFTPENTQDFFALSGGLDGDVGQMLTHGQFEQAKQRAQFWKDLFGERYFLQITALQKPEEAAYQSACAQLAAELQLNAVATNYACFRDTADFEAHELRVCISSGEVMSNPNRAQNYTPHYALKTEAQLSALLPEVLLHNSEHIAMECNTILSLGKAHLPPFPTPDGSSQEAFLGQCARLGLEERLKALWADEHERAQHAPRYHERLERELGVIQSMGFAGYFLIVMDFIQWAKAHGIPVGPGRGSGAGSLVAYALKITDLDPMPYDLLFERFLNPERVSMPDFDIDFCMDRRDEVIHYVMDKYGHERVGQIATHGTMAAKGVLKDVGRVLGLPYNVTDRLSKMIPPILGTTLKHALGIIPYPYKDKDKPDMRSPELIKAYQEDEEAKWVIDYALQLEGLTRSVGKHAGGVVIAPTTLTDFTALYPSEDSIISQFDKNDIEAAGLVKFDFLGLRTLTIIDWAVQHINRARKAKGQSALHINELPLDDKATFALMQRADTTAVFQLESAGMKELIKRLNPELFEEIIALVALFRPGPLNSGMTDEFVKRKHGTIETSYPHPALESVLNNTYGVVVYQEQVMQIAQVLANYTLGGADELRRAMGKKDAEKMAKQRGIFIQKAVENGVDEAVATSIFRNMEKFAEYGFNKSHSATYALLAYQTAWLKVHYPAEFMAAVLSSEIGKPEKIVKFLEETRNMGLTILPPCINRSQYHFMPNNSAVVYGLGGVKGVGEGVVAQIVNEREQNGAYTSLANFCQRVDLKRITRRVLETLVTVGAFDALNPNRGALLHALPQMIALSERHISNQKSNQSDLFGLFGGAEQSALSYESAIALDNAFSWTERDTLENEKAILGFYLSGHPLQSLKATLKQLTTHTLGEIPELYQDDNPPETTERSKRFEWIKVGGIVVEARHIVSKNQKNMCFLTLDDGSGQLEVGVFAKKLEEYKALCVADNVVVVEMRPDYDNTRQSWRFSANRIQTLENARSQNAKSLTLCITPQTRPDYAQWLREILTPTVPEHGVSLQLHITARGGQQGIFQIPNYYLLSPEILEMLQSALGKEAVVVGF